MDEQVQAKEEMRGERGDLRDRLTDILSLLSEKGKAHTTAAGGRLPTHSPYSWYATD